MKIPLKSLFAITGLCLAVAPITGCTKKSKEASHVRKANAYFDAEQYGSAEVEYINALRIDPQDPQALGRLGLIHFSEGRPQSAYSLLAEAAQLKPDFLEVRKRLAQLQIQFGKYKDASDNLTYVLAHEPTDPDAPVLLVSTARTRAAVEEVRKQLEALPSPAPEGAPVIVALGTIDYHEHKLDEAAAEFAKALEKDPKSAEAKTALAYLYWSKNDRSKSESAFADAALLSGPHSPKQLQYAEFEARVGNVEAAKKILDTITKNAPDYLSAWIMMAQIAAQEKRYDEGEADIARVLAIDSRNPAAMLENSRLQLAKGDSKGAVTDLESASKNYPKSVGIDFQLAKAYLAEGNADKAEMSLRRGLEIAPTATEAQMMLAGIYVKKGQLPQAIALLQKVIHDHPDSLQARLLLGEAYRSHGELDEALSVYRQISEANPKDFESHMLIGDIYLQQRQPDKAKAAFEKARSINQDYLPALEHLIDLDLNNKNFDEAHRRIDEQIKAHPSDGIAQIILAKIYLGQRDGAGAEAALKHSIELQPDVARAYELLAGLYLSTNRESEALAELQALVAKNPKNIDAMMMIATIQTHRKDYEGARANYEKILSTSPDAVAALNNLAYLYAEQLNDLDKGLETAEKAARLLPDEPHVADTLGWILYRQHKYTRALALLSDSANRLPSEADVQFHLGMTEYMMGREEAARDNLQRAIDLSPQFAGRDQALHGLAEMRRTPGKGGDAERADLEKEASDQKDDPVVRNHLAAFYEGEGSLDKAIAACNEALNFSPDNPEVLTRLARLYLAKNDTAKAIEYGKKARALSPDEPQLARVLGEAAFRSGDYPWSLSLFQEASQKLPDDPDVHFDLGSSYYSEGNVPDAETQMKAALQAGPAFKRSNEATQFVQMLDLAADPRLALQSQAAIQHSLESDPGDPAALMASAAAHGEQGDVADAKKEYDKVLTRFPDFTPAKRDLAIILSASAEDDKRAFDLALKARAAFPDDPILAQALAVLDYRRGDYLNAKNLLTDASAQRADDPELNFYLGMADFNLKDAQGAKAALQKALDLKLSPPKAAEAHQTLDKIK
jgi:putative PEP-CTERM system TPR-repeat lipoprotein